MTPRSDPEEDMSMEEILASIRKFVSENPQEEAYQQRNHKGEISDSVASVSRGNSRRQDNRVHHTPSSPLNFDPFTSGTQRKANQYHIFIHLRQMNI